MLAGNITSINANRHTAAAGLVGRYSSPAAPASSSTPVTVTSNPGAGNGGGTIAIKSRRSGLTKCATPVITNMAASPTAAACGQLSTYSTPSQPTRRAPSVPKTSVTTTAIAGSYLDSVKIDGMRLSRQCQDLGARMPS